MAEQKETPEPAESAETVISRKKTDEILSNLTSVADKEENIRVVVRFRPVNKRERHEEKSQHMEPMPIKLSNNNQTVAVPRKNKPILRFDLDKVLWSNVTQQQAFADLAQPLVEQVIQGFNCTIFAFGQTGSGKTFTMFGPDNISSGIDMSQLGIIPRSIDYLFELLKSSNDVLRFSVTVSVVEVYKEMLRDLLDKESNKRLEVYTSGNSGTVIKGLVEQPASDVDTLLGWIVKAQRNRRTVKTEFIGHHSSRSHCVVMINVTQRLLDDTLKVSKLNFGDLAGSELSSRTGASGETMKEAGKIHQGLLVLERVITALCEGKKFVPYKDSKLTRILHDSLGGNSKTTLIVACSPHEWNRAECVSTLQFAKRSKNIKNKAKINKRMTRDQLEAKITSLEQVNSELKAKMRQKLSKQKTEKIIETVFDEEKEQALENALAEIARLQALLKAKDERVQQQSDDLQSKDDTIAEFGSMTHQLKKKDNDIDGLKEEIAANEEMIASQKQQLKSAAMMESSLRNTSQNIDDKTQMLTSAFAQMQAMMAKLQTTVETIAETQSEQGEKLDKLSEKPIDSGAAPGSGLPMITEADAHPRLTGYDSGAEMPSQNQRMSMASMYGFPAMGGFSDDTTASEIKDLMGEIKTYFERSRTDRKSNGRMRELSQISEADMGAQPPASNAAVPVPVRMPTIEANNNAVVLDAPPPNMRHYSTDDFLSIDDDYVDTPATEERRTDTPPATAVVQKSHPPLTLHSASRKISNRNIDDSDDDEKELSVRSLSDEDNMIGSGVVSPGRPSEADLTLYEIGLSLDVLDSTYHWYSAQVVQIDPLMRGMLIKYDGFDERWNEWIEPKRAYRIAPHMSRSQGKGQSEGGVHVLTATKYGKSNAAEKLRTQLQMTEKYLTAFQDIRVLMCGHLHKRGYWHKEWKRRWFTLCNDNCLYYYQKKSKNVEKYSGVIRLAAVTDMGRVYSNKQYSFDILTKKRKYKLAARDETDLVDWMSAIDWMRSTPIDFSTPAMSFPTLDQSSTSAQRGETDATQQDTNLAIPLIDGPPSRHQKQDSAVGALVSGFRRASTRMFTSTANNTD